MNAPPSASNSVGSAPPSEVSSGSRKSGASSASSIGGGGRTITNKFLHGFFLLSQHVRLPALLFILLLIYESFQTDSIILSILSAESQTLQRVSSLFSKIFLFNCYESSSPDSYMKIFYGLLSVPVFVFVCMIWAGTKNASTISSDFGFFLIKVISTVLSIIPYVVLNPWIWVSSRLTVAMSTSDWTSSSLAGGMIAIGIISFLLIIGTCIMFALFFFDSRIRMQPSRHRAHTRDDVIVFFLKIIMCVLAWQFRTTPSLVCAFVFLFQTLTLTIKVIFSSFYSDVINIIGCALVGKTAATSFGFCLYMFSGNTNVYRIVLYVAPWIGMLIGGVLSFLRLFLVRRNVIKAVIRMRDVLYDDIYSPGDDELRRLKENAPVGLDNDNDKVKLSAWQIRMNEIKTRMAKRVLKKSYTRGVTKEAGMAKIKRYFQEKGVPQSLTRKKRKIKRDIERQQEMQTKRDSKKEKAIGNLKRGSGHGSHRSNAHSFSHQPSSQSNKVVSSTSGYGCIEWSSVYDVEMSIRPLLKYLRALYSLGAKDGGKYHTEYSVLRDVVSCLYEIAQEQFPDNMMLIAMSTMFLYSFRQDRLLFVLRKAKQTIQTASLDVRMIIFTADELHKQEQVDSTVAVKHNSGVRKARRLTSQGLNQLLCLWRVFVQNAAYREGLGTIFGEVNDDSFDPQADDSMVQISGSHHSSMHSTTMSSTSLDVADEAHASVMVPAQVREKVLHYMRELSKTMQLADDTFSTLLKRATPALLRGYASYVMCVCGDVISAREYNAQSHEMEQYQEAVRSVAPRLSAAAMWRELVSDNGAAVEDNTMQLADDTFSTLLKRATPALLRGYASYVMCVCGDVISAREYNAQSHEMEQYQEAVRSVAPRLSAAAMWRELVSDNGAAVEDNVSQDYLSLGGDTFAPGYGIRRMEEAFGTSHITVRLCIVGILLCLVLCGGGIIAISIGQAISTNHQISEELTSAISLSYESLAALKSVSAFRHTSYADYVLSSARTSSQAFFWKYDLDSVNTRENISTISGMLAGETASSTVDSSLIEIIGTSNFRQTMFFSDVAQNYSEPDALDVLLYNSATTDDLPDIDWTPSDGDLDDVFTTSSTEQMSIWRGMSTVLQQGISFLDDYPTDAYFPTYQQTDQSVPDIDTALQLTRELTIDSDYRSFINNLQTTLIPTLEEIREARPDHMAHMISVMIWTLLVIVFVFLAFTIIPIIIFVHGPIASFFQQMELYMGLLFGLSFEEGMTIYEGIKQRGNAMDVNMGSSIMNSSRSDGQDFHTILSGGSEQFSNPHAQNLDHMDGVAPSDGEGPLILPDTVMTRTPFNGVGGLGSQDSNTFSDSGKGAKRGASGDLGTKDDTETFEAEGVDGAEVKKDRDIRDMKRALEHQSVSARKTVEDDLKLKEKGGFPGVLYGKSKEWEGVDHDDTASEGVKQRGKFIQYLSIACGRIDCTHFTLLVVFGFFFLVFYFIAFIALHRAKVVSTYSHSANNVNVSIMRAYSDASLLVLSEVGELTTYHAELERDRVLKLLQSSSAVLDEDYSAFIEGYDEITGVVERFPAIMPYIFSPACLYLHTPNCTDDTKLTLNDVLGSYIVELSSLGQEEVSSVDHVTADDTGYQTLNGTDRIAVTGGMFNVTDFLTSEYNKSHTVFIVLAAICFVMAIAAPFTILLVSRYKDLDAALRQRDLVFTTWGMLPTSSIPDNVKEGKDLQLLLLFMKHLNAKQREENG
ncbi:hypothetical protein ADUPG1_010233 [Aduncisulcus paluster]|uniref:Uncharacterized protein n=1 Tax=Aduncisulcus paluster TaxID=2918883 RepID=A0ABQ5JW13_9EUKA|nr:hypothetical protein ADUPG1_010233 [Aduncisulcus paluster]